MILFKRCDANGEWRRFQNEELRSLYCSLNIARANKSTRLKWAGHVATMEEGRNAFKILTGKPTGKPKYRWEDNSRKDLKGIGINTMKLVDSAQDRDYWEPL